MADSQVILSMEGVTKVYGSGELAVTALQDVNFEARSGEVALVMGPSGSGKTTLLTIAGALLRPTFGSVRVCGEEISGANEASLAAIRRDKVGFVYQSFNLLEALTVMENVWIVARDAGVNGKAADTVHELLDVFGLSHRLKALPRQLSDGEKQRVALARAIAKNPVLILADEPTANLDAKRGHEVVQLLRQKAVQMNKGVVIVSHDQRIRDVADRVVWLEDGRLRPEA